VILWAALRDALKWKLVKYNAAAAADPPTRDSSPISMIVWTGEQLRNFLDSVAEWKSSRRGLTRADMCFLVL
jgi:hypothetical protein